VPAATGSSQVNDRAAHRGERGVAAAAPDIPHRPRRGGRGGAVPSALAATAQESACPGPLAGHTPPAGCSRRPHLLRGPAGLVPAAGQLAVTRPGQRMALRSRGTFPHPAAGFSAAWPRWPADPRGCSFAWPPASYPASTAARSSRPSCAKPSWPDTPRRSHAILRFVPAYRSAVSRRHMQVMHASAPSKRAGSYYACRADSRRCPPPAATQSRPGRRGPRLRPGIPAAADARRRRPRRRPRPGRRSAPARRHPAASRRPGPARDQSARAR